jgi:hypothetical protein
MCYASFSYDLFYCFNLFFGREIPPLHLFAVLLREPLEMMRRRDENFLDLIGFLVGELIFNAFALKPCPHHNIYCTVERM